MFKVAVQVAVLVYAVAVGGGTMAVQVALARRKWLCTSMHWLWRVAVQVACRVAVQVACRVAVQVGNDPIKSTLQTKQHLFIYAET
jgi:hypothetical protein